MGTQVVRHTSRGVNITLNFASTENNLSWSYTQEGDGEIYDVVLSNVASYTIGGAVPALPQTVTNGTSYAIAITKTTNGQPASITLKTRRQADKTVSLSVPDFGAYDGRYLYVLLNNNTVSKLDAALLVASNYAGAGAWTVSPIVATITLPTLPSSAIYTYACFVKHNGIQRIMFIGIPNNTFNVFATYIRLSDDTVWDIPMTTQNAYTQINASATQYTSGVGIAYDYVSERIIVKTANGSQGQTAFSYNLLSGGAITNYGYSSSQDSFFVNTHRAMAFNPITGLFIRASYMDIPTSRVYGLIFGNQSMNNTLSVAANRVYAQQSNSSLNTLRAYNATTGELISVHSGGINISGFAGDLLHNNGTVLILSAVVANNTYVLHRFTTAKGGTLQNVGTGQTFAHNPVASKYTGNFFAKGANGAVGVLRLYCFQYDQTPADFGYLDFANTIQYVLSTQLIE